MQENNKKTTLENQKEQLKIISMESVKEEAVSWFWRFFIAFGKLTIIQGDPGEGKTTLALFIAALATVGKRLGDSENNYEPLTVLYQTAEDGLADTVKKRLREAGADCSKVKVIDETDKSLTMDDVRLEQAINQTGAKLVILDPISAYLGSNVDMHRANDTREVTKRLSILAEKTGCAIILIGHMNKSALSKAIYRGVGSIDIFAVARSVLLVARVPSQPNIRAIAQIKNNLAPEEDIVAFELGENGFKWVGDYDISVDELLSGCSSGNKHDKAETLLNDILAAGAVVSVLEIFARGKAIGISKRTLENVKQELSIKSVRTGKTWSWKF